jgi:phosphoribosyl 1,2-cyclic phosphodiesterase
MSILSTCVLGSSSAGNSTLIWTDETAILIDCGFTPGYLTFQLRKLGLSISDLDAVLITHIHGDHVNESAVGKLFREHIPIYCPPAIDGQLRKKYHSAATASRHELLKPMTKSETSLDHVTIRSFEVPHDSDGGCFGYNVFFHANGTAKKVSVATDLSSPTKLFIDHMVDSDVIVIESNYDVQMLEDSSRPAWLKKRIQDEGHLSNDQCAEALLQIIDKSKSQPTSVALAHVSQECNTNALARGCTEAALGKQGIVGIDLCETYPDRPGPTITV